ncbi:MAG: histidine phosphatase family protein [Clostridia bacterium]|nr:histidine phosphatase family protein [Clostridia bacterium]
MMTTVLFIRHGESVANRRNIFAGHLDVELEELGFLQAAKTAEFITEKYKVDAIYSSDLQRAYNTAKALSDRTGIPIIKEKAFREIDGGEWDEKNFDALDSLFPEEFGVWRRDLKNARCTGGESVKEVAARVFAAAKKIAAENEGKTIAIFSHVTPIRCIECMARDGSVEKIADHTWVSNASVSEFLVEDGQWKVIEMSQDKHLSGMRTALPDDV